MFRLILGLKFDHNDSYRAQYPLYRLAAVCGKKDVIIHQVDTMFTAHLTGGDISQEIGVALNRFVDRIKGSQGGTEFCIINGLEVGITPPNPPYATYQMRLCPEMDQETVKAVSDHLINQGFRLVQSGYTRNGAQYDYFKENQNPSEWKMTTAESLDSAKFIAQQARQDLAMGLSLELVRHTKFGILGRLLENINASLQEDDPVKERIISISSGLKQLSAPADAEKLFLQTLDLPTL